MRQRNKLDPDTANVAAAQQRAMEGLEARISELERARQIEVVMTYVREAEVDDKALVSVVMPTRNRSRCLPRAVASVARQSHPTWELLVVDDGGEDETAEVLDAFDDPRIRRFQIPHSGQATARNRALREAAGDYVVYLDDDNTMHPDWLRSVVWAFGNWPDVDVLYGATLIDRDPAARESDRPGTPTLWFVPFDTSVLRKHNVTDIGSIAHRAGLPEATFDEELRALEDWDLLLRLSREREPLALPVVACIYSTTSQGRLSGSSAWNVSMQRLRAKHSLDVISPSSLEG